MTASAKDHTIYTYVSDNDVNFKERELETEMKSVINFRQHYCIAKQVGMSAYWPANNSLSLDRTPEGITPGSTESVVNK